MNFKNLGSLITYEEDGQDVCLGYLLCFPDKGVFDAELGKVDISPEHVETHNALLDQALLEGLDKNCAIGECGTFYYGNHGMVKTWGGTIVSREVSIKGKSITFRRLGKTYRGRLQKHADCFNFRRIA